MPSPAEVALERQDKIVDLAKALCGAYADAGRRDSPASNRAHALWLAERAYRRTLQLRVDRERGVPSSRGATVRRGDQPRG